MPPRIINQPKRASSPSAPIPSPRTIPKSNSGTIKANNKKTLQQSSNENLAPKVISQNPKHDSSDDKLTNEERLINLLQRIIQIDPEDHQKRGILMSSISLFLPTKTTSIPLNITELLNDLLVSVFSTSPPFSVITRSYKQVFFNPISLQHDDITTGYKLFKYLPETKHSIPLLKALMRRLTSASNSDRNGAKECLQTITGPQVPLIIHLLALTLTPPPPHGVKDLLEVCVHFLSIYKPPPPLFDDFFVTTSFDANQDVLSISSMVSEARLNDGITIFNELWTTFRMLHYAPHYQTFFQPFLKALCALIDINESFAHDCRRFIINHWPRLDPQKAVLFMQEATCICLHGPPIDEPVWQNLSFRASSIQWQIAMEGLNFVEKTISRTEGFNHSILTFLLQDTAKNHWNRSVRTRAEHVLTLVPKTDPKRPEVLSFAKWSKLRDMAAANYPNDHFQQRRIPGQPMKAPKQ